MIVDVINPKHCLRWFLLIWPVHTHWWHKSLPSVSHIQSKLVQWNCLMVSFRKNSVIHPSVFIHKALLWLVLRSSLLFFFFFCFTAHILLHSSGHVRKQRTAATGEGTLQLPADKWGWAHIYQGWHHQCVSSGGRWLVGGNTQWQDWVVS